MRGSVQSRFRAKREQLKNEGIVTESQFHNPALTVLCVPTPYSPHPARYTLHSTLCTLYPTSYTLHSTPYTLHPTPFTPHPTPYTLHPPVCILHPTRVWYLEGGKEVFALGGARPIPVQLHPCRSRGEQLNNFPLKNGLSQGQNLAVSALLCSKSLGSGPGARRKCSPSGVPALEETCRGFRVRLDFFEVWSKDRG